jgi:hypothetical protein
MLRENIGPTFKSNFKVFFLFFLMAYTAYAIGINLGEFIFVRPDSKFPIPAFLNFSNSFWYPYVQSGYFSLLEPQYQSFYPLAYFLKFKASAFTFNLFYLLNIALTGFCLFLYLREISLNVYASILGGMTFMLSGFVAGHKMHTALVSATAWVPLVLFFLERSFKDESRRSLQLVYGAFAFSLVVLAGWPGMVVDGAIIVSGYALFRISFGCAFKDKMARDKLLVFFKSLLLIFIPGSALASIALVPAFESLPLINRQQISFKEFSFPGWTPDALPMVLFPFFYGDFQPGLYPSPYFGPANLWEISWFIGVLPFSLFLYTFYVRKELPQARIWIACFFLGICLVAGDESLARRNIPFFRPYLKVGRDTLLEWFASSNLFTLVAILLVGAAASTLLLWLKRNPKHQFAFGVLAALSLVSIGSPLLYRLLYHVPVLNLFRVPAKHLVQVNLAMAILSAIGFNYLIENRSDPKALASRLRKLSVLMALLGFSFVAGYYVVILPRIRKITPTFPAVDVHLIIPITAIAVTIVVLNVVTRFRTSRYFLAAVMVFVFLDQFSFSRFHYNSPISIGPTWDCLKIKSLENDHSNFRVSIGNDREGLCGLLGIQGNNAVWLNHYIRMLDFQVSSNLRDNPKLLENSNMLRMLSVKYVSDTKELLNHNLVSPEFELIEEKGEEALYVNKRFLPRIRFVKELQGINDFSEAKRIVYSANFDPGNVALLTDVPDKALDNGEIIESQFGNDLIRIKANTGKEAFLVFSDSWHPGWRVFVDKKPATLVKPYAFQMGVNIFGQGEHLIEFRFEPTVGYFVGKWVSLITLSLMICFVFHRWYRQADLKARPRG